MSNSAGYGRISSKHQSLLSQCIHGAPCRIALPHFVKTGFLAVHILHDTELLKEPDKEKTFSSVLLGGTRAYK